MTHRVCHWDRLTPAPVIGKSSTVESSAATEKSPCIVSILDRAEHLTDGFVKVFDAQTNDERQLHALRLRDYDGPVPDATPCTRARLSLSHVICLLSTSAPEAMLLYTAWLRDCASLCRYFDPVIIVSFQGCVEGVEQFSEQCKRIAPDLRPGPMLLVDASDVERTAEAVASRLDFARRRNDQRCALWSHGQLAEAYSRLTDHFRISSDRFDFVRALAPPLDLASVLPIDDLGIQSSQADLGPLLGLYFARHATAPNLSDNQRFEFGPAMLYESTYRTIAEQLLHKQSKAEPDELWRSAMLKEFSEGLTHLRRQNVPAFECQLSGCLQRLRPSQNNRSCLGCCFLRADTYTPCGHGYCSRCAESLEFGAVCLACRKPIPPLWFDWILPKGLEAVALCLDGGAVRFCSQNSILRQMERILEELTGLSIPLARYFDLLVGVSAGGVATLGLAFPRSLEECSHMTKQLVQSIFPPMGRVEKVLKLIRALNGSTGIYDARPPYREAFGKRRMLDHRENVGSPRAAVMSTASRAGRAPWCAVLTNCPVNGKPSPGITYDYSQSMALAAACTSAAPGFFSPIVSEGIQYEDGVMGKLPHPLFIVKGLVDNIWRGARARIFSVGCGRFRQPPIAARQSLWTRALKLLSDAVDQNNQYEKYRVNDPEVVRANPWFDVPGGKEDIGFDEGAAAPALLKIAFNNQTKQTLMLACIRLIIGQLHLHLRLERRRSGDGIRKRPWRGELRSRRRLPANFLLALGTRNAETCSLQIKQSRWTPKSWNKIVITTDKPSDIDARFTLGEMSIPITSIVEADSIDSSEANCECPFAQTSLV